MTEVERWGFADVAELLNAALPTQDLGVNDPQYGSPVPIRIDHVMVKGIAREQIDGFQTVNDTRFSDHRPLILQLNEQR